MTESSVTEIEKKYNITRSGKGGRPMLFAHGYGCDQNMWRFIVPAFQEQYDSILFDLIGSGKSDEDAYDFQKYNSLAGYADDVIEICDTLSLENVIFVGHSVSSMIGAIAVSKRPDLFDKLIMVCPSPRYINDEHYHGGFEKGDIDELVEALESNYLGWSSQITPAIIGASNDQTFATELANSFCRMNPDIAKHFAKVTFLGDYREHLKDVDTPSLIIQTDPDMIAPPQVGTFVHESIQQSTFVKIDASGHCPHLTDPEMTIAAIRSFLEI